MQQRGSGEQHDDSQTPGAIAQDQAHAYKMNLIQKGDVLAINRIQPDAQYALLILGVIRRRIRMEKITLMLVCILLNTSPLFAGEKLIFSGIPEIKISEGGLSRIPENINKEKALGAKCTISKIDDKYLWTTREDIELIPVESGAYITFLAVNGSGYIRVIKPDMKDVIKQMGAMAGDPEEKFDYVEHLILGLKSITYYGILK